MKLHCYRCKKSVKVKLSRSGPHQRADCASCGRFIKFIGKQDHAEDTDPIRMINPGESDYKAPSTYRRKIHRRD